MPALRIANLLVAIMPMPPRSEITLGQLTVEFEVMGGLLYSVPVASAADDNAVWTGWPLPMKAGQRLRYAAAGCQLSGGRGGIDVPPVMGHAAPISRGDRRAARPFYEGW
ncbi:hypothetical protein ACNKHP_21355 [Shigella boydii]